MNILLEYLRPFYPLKKAEIGESPFGRPFAFASPVTDNREWEFEIERLLEEVCKNHEIPFKVTLVGNPYVISEFPDIEVEEHSEVFRRMMNRANDLVAVVSGNIVLNSRLALGEDITKGMLLAGTAAGEPRSPARASRFGDTTQCTPRAL